MNTRRSVLGAWAILLCPLVLVACDDAPVVGGSAGGDGAQAVDGALDGGAPDGAAEGCGATADCPPGEVCRPDGRCAPRCALGDCPEGYCSADGWCVDGPCPDDAACPPGAWCAEDGQCRPGCRGDADCPAGRTCGPDHQCVEEGPCVADRPCETGLPGPCAAGLTRCPEGGGAACEPARPPTEEICNGLDDDCDGAADEAWPDLGAPCPGGEGACAAAARFVCADGGAGLECDLLAGATDERCNGIDDDCDGAVDEDFPQLGGPCGGGEGTCAVEAVWQCAEDGADAICPATPGEPAAAERCDGLDDDCDGRTDEDWPALGTPCRAGLGLCARDGVHVCGPDGEGTRCSELPGAPAEEICDGLDNDCDGRIDEAPGGDPLTRPCFSGPEDRRGVGPCRGGMQICVAGGWSACEGEVAPAPEQCNGVDDDCNGEPDDDGRGGPLVQRCYRGPAGTEGVGLCRGGFAQCGPGGLGACLEEVLPAVEICDGLDNDCDGVTDEVAGGCDCEPGERRACYGGPEGTGGVGRCAPGEQVCGQNAWGPCGGHVLPVAEVCNGIDDDCDGRTDEDLPVGGPCRTGEGACVADGVVACAGNGLFCDAPARLPAAERCDGIDNDCDGRTDEAFAVGEPCRAGTGACARDGVTACGPRGELVCTAQPAPPEAERCNGLDEDCDGVADEDFGVGGPCFAGLGLCERQGALACDGEGRVVCDAVPGAPLPERCDGFDNDCDGRADEGFALAERCEVGTGACVAAGFTVCGPDGGVICAAEPGSGRAETCNGFDDDCDGRIDEDVAPGGGCFTGELGACRFGRLLCVDGGRICTRSAEPVAEICDGIDNDCDGAIDEGLGQVDCGVGVCLRRIPACTDGRPTACDPRVGAQPGELCNGLDDDCDGRTDEAAQGADAPCGVGVGACQRVGRARCVAGALTCDAVAGEPAPELCNGDDDDCDGATDEDAAEVGRACALGLGECRAEGVLRCVEGVPTCDAEPGDPGVEACNALDDDCDGELDEGFGSTVCGLGVCRRAVPNCEGGEPPACVPLDAAGPEACNGEDDDCDGTVDEDAPGTGAACTRGVGECRRAGVTVCQGGALTCGATPGAPREERCDNLDNDCDGRIDEDFREAGQVCGVGFGACAREGGFACRDGRLECDAVPGAPGVEVCNGIDDDCDGAADEALGTVPCGLGLCRRDIPACTRGAPTACDPLAGAVAETCNGFDDDCDGRVDEETLGSGEACAVGTGACRRDGQLVCRGAVLGCDAVAGDPEAEICDGVDNDCDRLVDEQFGVGQPCGVGTGACRREGRRACDGQGGVTCDAEVGAPAVEACNGVDDDCDGTTDENPGDLGACDTGLPGVCAAGRFACVGGGPACTPEVPAAAEICDGLDNDCDGAVDEDQPTIRCGLGNCERALPACRDGVPVVCNPLEGARPELCNGEDDDCDGRFDENAEGHLAPCAEGVGACRRSGIAQCRDGRLECGAEPFPPQAELCNGVDDDCDGVTDEDARGAGAPCSAGVGACRVVAAVVCEGGALSCPAVAGEPGEEVCNGVDDDCDGELDEGFGSVVCGVGACRHAVPRCDGGEAPACDPLEGAAPETCNGVDDDCDGAIDEDAPGVGAACSAGLGLCRRAGTTECAGGALVCGAVPGQPAPEQCNGEDDDCDGVIDEQPDGVGAPCMGGEGQCRAEGALVCRFGALRCDVAPGAPAPEACNGLDDDCDGVTDEGIAPVTCGVGICHRQILGCAGGQPPVCDPLAGADEEVCNGADDDCDGLVDEDQGVIACGLGACAHEVPRCLGGRVNACNPFEGAGAEVCNGVDDDCDGRVDENALGAGAPCRAGEGQCTRLGTARCTDGVLACDVQPGAPVVERCDGVDNDCDGRVDEADRADAAVTCARGVGGCERIEIMQCVEGELLCPAVPGAPAPEVCDGVDNDCDGFVDEPGPEDPDCDENGIADECDILTHDCNRNGRPDRCDINANTSRDCNGNGIPDECNNDGAECLADQIPPTAGLDLQTVTGFPNEPIEIRITASDNVGIESITLTLDGVPLPLDGGLVLTLRIPAPGLHDLVLEVRDFAGNTTRIENVLRIFAPDDVTFPTAEIHAPDDGLVLAGPTEVIGTADDENLMVWALYWGQPPGPPDTHLLATGDAPVREGVLTVLDPADFEPGDYELALVVQDINGRASAEVIRFRVQP